jgi:hypothetical protein
MCGDGDGERAFKGEEGQFLVGKWSKEKQGVAL